MCGINGFIKKKIIADELVNDQLKAMNACIVHRGPDDEGIFVENHKNTTIAMGMQRLAIIDLEMGKQPMTNAEKTIVLVFNGEIYNFKVLKDQLEKEGVQFSTNSDTEVLLKLYDRDGQKAFSKLNGMFACSIFDKSKEKLFIARDFFGEKPLYYSDSKEEFIWGSELKSLLRVRKTTPPISYDGLNFFFRLTYIPAPFTIYEGIQKLPSNSYLEYDLATLEFKIHSIEKEFKKSKSLDSFETAKKKVRNLVEKSVESRSIADVPIGTFLSGGVDSSIVSLCLAQSKNQPINTFSIGFEKKEFDETDKSRVIAKQIGSKHHEFLVKEEDFKENLEEILLNFDEPFSDTAALPTYLVSKKTREHVKVALTGDGGDEVFGGYNKYYVGKINTRYTSIIPKGLHRLTMQTIYPLLHSKEDRRDKRFAARKMLNAINYEGNYFWDIISLANTHQQLKNLLRDEVLVPKLFEWYQNKLGFAQPKTLTEFRFTDKIVSLEGGMLPKVDRTSMLSSLECRAPFLNKEIWNYTNSLPESYLLNGFNKKYILKEAFKKDFPEGFLEKGKQGFETPVGDWLRNSLKKELLSYIETDFLIKQKLFKVEYVRTLVQNHVEGKKDNSYMVWAFYCFQKWYSHAYSLKTLVQ